MNSLLTKDKRKKCPKLYSRAKNVEGQNKDQGKSSWAVTGEPQNINFLRAVFQTILKSVKPIEPLNNKLFIRRLIEAGGVWLIHCLLLAQPWSLHITNLYFVFVILFMLNFIFMYILILFYRSLPCTASPVVLRQIWPRTVESNKNEDEITSLTKTIFN